MQERSIVIADRVSLRRNFIDAARVCLAVATIGFFGASEAYGARVVITCGSVGEEFEVCRSGARAWAEKTSNEVEVFASPASSGERLSQMQLLLAAKATDIDVFLIDATWPGMLGDFFVDLSRAEATRDAARAHFPSFIRNNTIGGKLVAIPWFIDAGLLFYRKDLLAKHGERAPETWREMTRIARKIQEAERKAGNRKFWGYVFQGRAYEGLTCNALEWIHSHGGGTIVDAAGSVTIRNPRARRALELAASWIGAISPPGALNYMEEEARGVFQSGNAAFLRNWPYAWKLAQAADSPIRGKVAIKTLPRGEGAGTGSASALGGWSLAVSKYSKNPEAAAGLVAYLTGPEEQKRRARALGQNPTIPALYSDPDLVREYPHFPALLDVFENAVPRPSAVTGARYNRVSSEAWDTVHQVLSGRTTAEKGLEELEKRLVFLGRGGKW